MTWKDWRQWEDLHSKWIEIYGPEKVRDISHFRAIYEWLMREAGGRPVEELHIDLLLHPSMTYEDAKKILKTVLEKPLSVEEMRELVQERIRQVKEEIKKMKEGH